MCAARISILDGTQPTFTQVPPIVAASMIVTRAPPSAARIAQANAPDPLPTIAICSRVPRLSDTGGETASGPSLARGPRLDPIGETCMRQDVQALGFERRLEPNTERRVFLGE